MTASARQTQASRSSTPVAQGGFALSRGSVTALLIGAMLVLIWLLPQRAGGRLRLSSEG